MKKARKISSIIVLLISVFSYACLAQDTLKPDSKGIALRQFYIGLDVENRWIAGQHIDWETGLPDDTNATHDTKTHCSAFVASACEKRNIYILRPPDHKQGLLANAQYDWLKTMEAYKEGWRPINDTSEYKIYITAQEYADKGYVVVAVIQNPDRHEPGHIALIMPEVIAVEQIKATGPEVIQAGKHNYTSAPLFDGFKSHITEWPEKGIRFYYSLNAKF
jgi:hypothetical protein